MSPGMRFRQNDGFLRLDGVLVRRNRQVSSKRSLLEEHMNETLHFGGDSDTSYIC